MPNRCRNLPHQRGAIFTAWRGKLRQLSIAQGLDHPTLTDHIPHFLDELIADLAQDRSRSLAEEHVKGSPPMHGVQRVTLPARAGEMPG